MPHRPGHVELTPPIAAFAPAYPTAVAVVHVLTRLGWEWCGQIVSLCMTFLAFAGLVLLTDRVEHPAVSDSGVLLLAAFLAMRRQRWLLAGLAAAGAAMTNFYLVIVVVALVFEYFDQRRSAGRSSIPDVEDAGPLALLSVPRPTGDATWPFRGRWPTKCWATWSTGGSSTRRPRA